VVVPGKWGTDPPPPQIGLIIHCSRSMVIFDTIE
jgi:hypothetical protein